MGILRKILHNLTLGIVESDEQIEARRKKREKEYDQSVAEDFKRFNDYNYRKNQAFSFDSRMSFEEFKALAINIAKPIKRLYVEVESHYVKGTVRTISGLDYWKFEIDFNDYGRLSGKYWIEKKENYDSDLPEKYADRLSMAINEYICRKQAYESFCPYCNNTLSFNKLFDETRNVCMCPYCGKPLINPNCPDVHIWYCNKCGVIMNNQSIWKGETGLRYQCECCGAINDLSDPNSHEYL